MTDTPRKDGPRTEAHEHPCEHCDQTIDYWTRRAIEAEAAAGPRDDGLLQEALDILERTHPSDPDNSPVFWDGWHAALAAVRVALAATTGAAPSESEERS